VTKLRSKVPVMAAESSTELSKDSLMLFSKKDTPTSSKAETPKSKLQVKVFSDQNTQTEPVVVLQQEEYHRMS